MNIIKRLTTLSVDNLDTLQEAILDEIQRRKDLLEEELVIDGQDSYKVSYFTPASKPVPTLAQPVLPRRAA